MFTELTDRELNRLWNKLANALKDHGVTMDRGAWGDVTATFWEVAQEIDSRH